MDNPVIILGAGKTGGLAAEIFKNNGVIVYCFLDEDEALHGTEQNDITILGDPSDDGFIKLIGKKCEVFVSYDNLAQKIKYTKLMMERRKTMPVNAIHSKSTISESLKLGHGNLITQSVSINYNVEIGNHCIINIAAIIDNNTKIGSYTQVGSGSIIGASVTIGDGVFIGSGVTILNGVKIEDGASIGTGSVVISNIGKDEKVFGNPAKKV